MKKLLFYLGMILCCSGSVIAQSYDVEVSEDYATVLVFKSNIQKTIKGNEKQYFFNEDGLTLEIRYIKVGNIEKKTNLIVFTADGNIYEFFLSYNNKPKENIIYVDASATSKGTFEVSKEEPQTIEAPKSNYSKQVVTQKELFTPKSELSYSGDKLSRVEQLCRQHIDRPKKIFRCYDKAENVSITLKDVTYDRDQLFFHFELSNKGGTSYDVDFINSRLASLQKGNKTQQTIALTPLFIYNLPERVLGKEKANFIMVFEKFSILENKTLQIDLGEKNGERDLLLNIKNRFIINPSKL